MRNRSTLIGIAILVVGLLVAVFVFTNINNTPNAGSGQTEIDNVSAGATEVAPDAVGGEAPGEPLASP